MRGIFAKNLFFILLVNLLVKPVWIFLIDRNVQNHVGHEAYGTYQALFNLGLIFQILLDFGVTSYNSRTLSHYPGKLNRIFPAMLTSRVLLSVSYLFIVCSIGYILGYRGPEGLLLAGVLMIQVLSSMLLFIRSTLSGLQYFRADGLLSVVDRFLMILFCGALLFLPATGDRFTIAWFVIIQIICYGISLIAGIAMLKKKSGVRLRFSLNIRRVWFIARKSLPYATLVFLMFVYSRADTLLLDLLSGSTERTQAGIYAASYRLLDVSNMFGVLLASMLLPVFGRLIAKKEAVVPIVRLCVNLLLPASFLAAAAGLFFHSEIMSMLYTNMQAHDYRVFALLMFSLPAMSLSHIYSALLTAKGCLKQQHFIVLAGVVVNLTLNFILIPRYFSQGAAIAAILTQVIVAAGFLFVTRKKMQLPVSSQWLTALVIYPILVAATGYGCTLLPLFWTGQLAVLCIAGILFFFLFRFIPLRTLVKQIKDITVRK